jgi:putative aldouronate transport system substrate-binding protein
MRKKFSILLFFGLIVSVAANLVACDTGDDNRNVNDEVINVESAYPIIKEGFQDDIKFTMMAPSYYTVDIDWANNKFFKRMNELTGVNFEFQVFNYDMYGIKKPLVLSSTTQMPDFFMKAMFDKTEIVKYGNQGLIIPLEDLIKDYMPNLKALMDNDPQIAKLITAPNGHIYSLPTIGEKDSYKFVGVPWINNQWLENLDMEMPTTPEEFYNVMKAFRDSDPNQNGLNDEIPMAISGNGELNFLFSFFGIDMESFMQIGKDGKLEFGPETQRYKDALLWLQKMYREGLIKKDYDSYSINQKWNDAAKGDKSTVGFFIDYAAYAVVGYDKASEYVTLDTVKNEFHSEAKWFGSYNVTDGFFVITKKCPNPKIIARWIDTMYDPEYSKWAVIGKEGEEWSWDNEERASWSYLIPKNERADYYSKATIQGGGAMPYLEPSLDFTIKCSDENYASSQREVAKMQKIGFEGFPSCFLKNSVIIKQASVMYADINTYIEQIKNSVIKGKSIDEAYANYDTMKKRLNIVQFMEFYEEAYNIYLNN